MLSIYIFSLVVGGGLLGMSLLGDFFGDADADLGGAEVDGDLAAALGGDGAEVASDGAEVGKLLSLRSLTYALFGFGGAGLVLHLAWGGPALVGAMVAAGMGIGSGALVSTVFGYLKRTEAGEIASEASLVGRQGTVTLPVGAGETGRVRLTSGHRQFGMRARSDDPEALETSGAQLDVGRRVVVTEVRDGVAYVAPLADEDLKLLAE